MSELETHITRPVKVVGEVTDKNGDRWAVKAFAGPATCGKVYGFGFFCGYERGHSGRCGHPKYDGPKVKQ